ncbi:MAG: hypothetical protein KDI01_12080 [Halioglobus sp.]|nr:hypothetical protein [Halioglobus sp.]
MKDGIKNNVFVSLDILKLTDFAELVIPIQHMLEETVYATTDSMEMPINVKNVTQAVDNVQDLVPDNVSLALMSVMT